MGRIGKLKRQLIEESDKRLLGEEISDDICKCPDGGYRIECCGGIKLHHSDEERLHDMFNDHNDHEESHTFMDTLKHSVHAHIGADHVTFEFHDLGKKHNIELDLEGGFHSSSHSDHDNSNYNLTPHIVFGGGIKIPIKSINKNK